MNGFVVANLWISTRQREGVFLEEVQVVEGFRIAIRLDRLVVLDRRSARVAQVLYIPRNLPVRDAEFADDIRQPNATDGPYPAVDEDYPL